MRWLAKLFGDVGIVRFEFELMDGSGGTGKMEIESIGHSNAEVEKEIKNILFVREGIRATSIKIIGFAET